MPSRERSCSFAHPLTRLPELPDRLTPLLLARPARRNGIGGRDGQRRGAGARLARAEHLRRRLDARTPDQRLDHGALGRPSFTRDLLEQHDRLGAERDRLRTPLRRHTLGCARERGRFLLPRTRGRLRGAGAAWPHPCGNVPCRTYSASESRGDRRHLRGTCASTCSRPLVSASVRLASKLGQRPDGRVAHRSGNASDAESPDPPVNAETHPHVRERQLRATLTSGSPSSPFQSTGSSSTRWYHPPRWPPGSPR